MKLGLLGFHLLYQFFYPIHRHLIGNGEAYTLVVLDLSVENYTLFTHGTPHLRVGSKIGLLLIRLAGRRIVQC
jgi:hypothetical protein